LCSLYCLYSLLFTMPSVKIVPKTILRLYLWKTFKKPLVAVYCFCAVSWICVQFIFFVQLTVYCLISQTSTLKQYLENSSVKHLTNLLCSLLFLSSESCSLYFSCSLLFTMWSVKIVSKTILRQCLWKTFHKSLARLTVFVQ